MKTTLYDQSGKESGTIDLNDAIFGCEVNEGLIHRAFLLQRANSRKNVAHTKTRGERAGSTRKLFRQKGTGRARAGASRSPIRIGGGVAFGPRNNQNFSIQMNKKERQKAIYCMLSSKLKDNAIVVVKDIKLKDIKTKDMQAVMQALPVGKTSLLALSEKNETVEKSASNLKEVKTIGIQYLNIADMLKYETLVLSEAGVKHLNQLV